MSAEKTEDVEESVVGESRSRKTLRFYDSDLAKLEYWADKDGISVNEFIIEAVNHYIAFRNGDYQLQTLEQQRLNQLTDMIAGLAQNVNSLSSIIVSSMGSITKLAQGSNYLLDEDSV